MSLQHGLDLVAAISAIVFLPLACSNPDLVDLNNPHDPQANNYSPSAPGTLGLSLASDTGIVVRWADNSRGEYGFVIERRTGVLGPFSRIDTTGADATTYFDRMTLTVNKTYFYRVAAVAKNGLSQYSTSSLNFQFPAPPIPWVYALDKKTIMIQWLYNDSVQEKFIVERSVNGGPFSVVAEPGPQARTYTDTDIDTSSSYSYRIKARSRYNESNYSPENHIQYIATDAQIRQSMELGKPVHSIAFSPDGSMLAATGTSFALRVWRTGDGRLVRDFGGAPGSSSTPGWPLPVAFGPDGNLLAANGFDGKVRVWRIDNGLLDCTISGAVYARSLCFSADGRWILTGDLSGQVSVWNIADSSLVMSWHATASDEVTFLYATRDGSRIVSGAYDTTRLAYNGLQIWNTSNWSLLKTQKGFNTMYYSISQDEKFLTAGGSAFSLVDGKIACDFGIYMDGQTGLSLDNCSFFGKNRSGTIRLGRVVLSTLITSKPASLPSDTYPAIACSPSEFVFASSGGSSGFVDLWAMNRAWMSDW